MNPSNMPPRPAAQGLRRAFLLQAAFGLLTVLLAAPAPALAQGVIQFTVGLNTYTRYQVNVDGTGLRPLPFPPTVSNRINATTRSDYPGGRQYLYPSNGKLMVWSELSGQ